LNCTASAFPAACCGECERIKKMIEYLTVEDSLQLAAGSSKIQNNEKKFDNIPL